jgi:cobalt-zinc-cadmium efflux system protein
MAHQHYNDNEGTTNLKIAFFLNVGFTIIEIIGGLYTNSIAILSDAVHDLGDSISLAASVIFEKISTKDPDRRYTFGYRRFSLLGALFSSLVLFGGTIFILTQTIPRLFAPEEVNPEGMFWFAILGIVFNGLAFWRLHSGTTINQKSVALHLLEDLLGWIAILIGSIVLLFVDLYILDAILSISISLYILYKVYRNLREVFGILLQKAPGHLDIAQIESDIEAVDGVKKAHHCHLWILTDDLYMMSIHITVNPTQTIPDIIAIKHRVREITKSLDIEHITIECEVEGLSED